MNKLELFWDVGSPYSYLAIKQLEKKWSVLKERVDLKPFLIGGVFKATGNSMPAAIPAKAAYMRQDLLRWAEKLKVPMKTPGDGTPFPINTLLPMRGATVAKNKGRGFEFCLELFNAYWGEGCDVSQPEVLGGVATAAGIEAGGFLEQCGAQGTKDKLRDTTAEAASKGAFGAPAIFVGDQHFWGNDRLQMAIEYLG